MYIPNLIPEEDRKVIEEYMNRWCVGERLAKLREKV